MAANDLTASIEKIADWCHGTWLQKDHSVVIGDLVTDSRKINNPADALFVALKTSMRNGHVFVSDAYKKGIRNFLVSDAVDTALYTGANFIQVKDTLLALQQMVAAYRRQFQIPVIGITGSNGKTVVKEWLYQLLSPSYNMVRSPKSYNSQVGVPLSVWLLERQHKLAVFEAGISQPGEMERLERIIQPSIGIFTNTGEAHSEGFLNMRQKINEKLLLFTHVSQLVYCRDYPELNECIAQFGHSLRNHDKENPLQLFTWSYKTAADLYISDTQVSNGKTVINALYKKENVSITIPFTDSASIENAIHCWCTMLLLDIDEEVIKERMLALQSVSMRLELRHGINGCTLINDTYNSDLTSLLIALDFLCQQKQHSRNTVILSDMLQVAASDNELYEEVADLIAQRNIKRFIGVGPALYKNKASFRKHKKLRSIFFRSTEELLQKLHLITFDNEAILLKGARAFRFEQLGSLLEEDVHQAALTIDLSALTHNLNTFRGLLAPGVKTMAMVKAFSYGSGSYEIANLLQYAGVDYLAVAYTDEGIDLRRAGITMPIMVMSPDAGSFDRMIAWKLEPEIFNLRSLQAFTAMAQTLNAHSYPIHIKLDTGMHRLGFVADDIDELIRQLNDDPYVKVASIFSHLAAGEDPAHDGFTAQQASLFIDMSDRISAALSYNPMRHICNSSGIARHKDLHFDMVRIGLGLYGIESSGTLSSKLKQISSLRTTIAQIKTIKAGETVGYGRKGEIKEDMRIATISIGYADGYPRALGNGKAHVLIRDTPAKVIGVIAMDMCMVDVTHIPNVQEGDEVIVFSPKLPLTQLAEWAGTIAYEMMTGISQRVKRIYVNEQ